MDLIIALFSIACQLGSSKVSEQTKIDCIDFMVNCSIKSNEPPKPSKIRECSLKFKDGERYK